MIIAYLNTKFGYCFDKSDGKVLVSEYDTYNHCERTGLISHELHLMTK